MDQKSKQQIVQIFQRNVGNTLTADLANGMIQAILQELDKEDTEE